MRVIGVLTAGGDCPGLNAVIRGVVAARDQRHGAEVVGILNGWDGLMDGRVRRLDRDAVRGILQRGGTILGTSRRDPYVHGEGAASLRETLARDGSTRWSWSAATGRCGPRFALSEEGIRLVGVPKTIDNDIAGTDVTFGFDTAVQIATEAIDRITTTAESHNRVMVVEVMGRTQGWIATYAGIAAGADAILVPEKPYDLEEVAAAPAVPGRAGPELLGRRRGRGHRAAAGGADRRPARRVRVRAARRRLGDRGGQARGADGLRGARHRARPHPARRDAERRRPRARVAARRGGRRPRRGGGFGRMVALRGTEIVDVALEEACAGLRGVPPEILDVAHTLSAP